MSKYEVLTHDGDTLGGGSLAEYVDVLLGPGAPREVVVMINLGVPFRAEVVKSGREPERLTVHMASYKRTFVEGVDPLNIKSQTPATGVPGTVEGILIYFEKQRFIALYPKGNAMLVISPHLLRKEGVTAAEFIAKAEAAVQSTLYELFTNQ